MEIYRIFFSSQLKRKKKRNFAFKITNPVSYLLRQLLLSAKTFKDIDLSEPGLSYDPSVTKERKEAPGLCRVKFLKDRIWGEVLVGGYRSRVSSGVTEEKASPGCGILLTH